MSDNVTSTTSAPTAGFPTVEEINGWDRERVKRFLQTKSTELELEVKDIDIIYSKKVSGKAFLRLTEEQLTRVPGTFQLEYTPASAIAELVKQIKGEQPGATELLSPNEVLSFVPPPPIHHYDASESITSEHIGGVWPEKITRWEEFLNKVNTHNFDGPKKFEKPRFDDDVRFVVEANVYTAMETNIFKVLNKVLEKCIFSKQRDSDFPRDDPNIGGTFVPDYTCRLNNSGVYGNRILVFEIKRHIVIQSLVSLSDEVLESQNYSGCGYLSNAIQQIYNYMSSLNLQYGILSSYEYHWFMYRPKNNNKELRISHSLPLDSTNPPVLKAYAYLAHLAERDYTSPNHNIMNHSRRQNLSLPQNLQNSESTQIPRSLNSSCYGSNVSSTFCGRETRHQDKEKVMEQDFDAPDFKLKGSLGCGQTGGTFECEFRGQMIALKVLDLYKKKRFFYTMQKEVEIYKRLSKIQGMFIPKLVCYGYYGGGMGYVMGTTIVGTTLRFHQIDQRQKSKALKALKIIHNHNILHNDIREENILVNEKGDIFFIDFGMSFITDKKKLFRQEESKLSRLLNCYMM